VKAARTFERESGLTVGVPGEWIEEGGEYAD